MRPRVSVSRSSSARRTCLMRPAPVGYRVGARPQFSPRYACRSLPADVGPNLREHLGSALQSGSSNRTPASQRFEHMLVREAFHDALPASERRRLHDREAQRMRARADREPRFPGRPSPSISRIRRACQRRRSRRMEAGCASGGVASFIRRRGALLQPRTYSSLTIRAGRCCARPPAPRAGRGANRRGRSRCGTAE